MPKNPATTTRDALLAAAREEFAAHGIAGARVDRIAARAGVNKERIYGYFGNKEKLFDAVIKDALDEFAAANHVLADDPVAYVGAAFDHYRQHPELLRLLMWEALHERSEPLPDQYWRAERCGEKVTSLAARLGEEPSPEVGRTVLSLLGLAMMPLAMSQLADLLGAGTDSPESAAAMREHVVRFARAALENRPSAT
ncbi:TetR/AcrR family transcriptional regulator [Actinomadura sp. WMMB 499]|uniref:TetR/AcrR family transcriptional regulator n=1 Tax=Actinomadura sp. WMMB 499 TaxID=1219491 RepID=UPI0012447A8D|nr:TetR family transcriptional regulator [Actinomadura sp. WMMB 499]QFG25809.1 TetR/AcrR family transcriptional regulator [Actinomadura sp. WMMB 499]